MEIVHVSAECYPAAKTGGLGDVVGALPKYLNQAGHTSSVFLPNYQTHWLQEQTYTTLHSGGFPQKNTHYQYEVRSLGNELGFELLVIHIPGLFDRKGIYADESGTSYRDDFNRWMGFAQAFLLYMIQLEKRPDIIHCHDHHTGIIPFLMNHGYYFQSLSAVPTVFTIHNGKYQGLYNWHNAQVIPPFLPAAGGAIEWNNRINLLAAGIKNSWRFTTVSESYLNELMYDSDGLEWLFQNEANKSLGILNGIDNIVWNPSKDPLIEFHYKTSLPSFKQRNKQWLEEQFDIAADTPVITFIGRLVHEKGIDFLINTLATFLAHANRKIHFIILGTGAKEYETALAELANTFNDHVSLILAYNEKLAHQLYAGSDFLIMPSRVEPCGLNQFYAMRYGTIPIVRRIGGLQDSVKDFGETKGTGICFNHLTIQDGIYSLNRVFELFQDSKTFKRVRKLAFDQDFSWEKSTQSYIQLYKSLKPIQ